MEIRKKVVLNTLKNPLVLLKSLIICILVIFLRHSSISLSAKLNPTKPALDARIKRVEHGLIPNPGIVIKGRPIPKADLSARMEVYRIPGVSIAVINDFKIEWSRGYGAMEVGGDGSITPQTLFQAASISKPVAALAALRLVQEGRLDLDEDINTKLVSWKLPESDFTKDKPVTLRRILSHSAGLTVSGFPGYKQGREIPSLRQILDGEKPANSNPIRVDMIPDTQVRYSGGGYTILQQLLIDQAKKPFPEIMRDIVLEPLEMNSSTFEQPIPPNKSSLAATAHLMNGRPVQGKWYTYPEMAAAGLWTTPADLSKMAIEMMLSRAGKSNKILSQAMTKEMLTAQKGRAGLGFFLEGEDRDFFFAHSGGNLGYRCFLCAFPEKGQGTAIMTNGDNGASLYQEILRSLAEEYKWKYFGPRERDVVKIDPEIIEAYSGTFRLSRKSKITITPGEQSLYVDPVYVFPTGKMMCEFFPESETVFFATQTKATISFLKDREGRVTGLMFKQYNRERKATRVE